MLIDELNYDDYVLDDSIDLLFVEIYFQLLGELLLDRHNFTIMTRYVSQPENLKTMMNMLRESSRNIQFEAFHVFKVCCHWFVLLCYSCPILIKLYTCFNLVVKKVCPIK